jgi:glucose/arabinose dehydrogenase
MKTNNKVLPIISLMLVSAASVAKEAQTVEKPVIERLKVAAGFEISVYADDLPNARQMALSPKGIVYVGSFRAGNLYAIKDSNNDGIADKKWLLAKDLKMPTGIAYKDGDLYVGVVDKILKFTDIDNSLDKPKQSVFFDGLPSDKHHGWKFLRFSPNGELIVPVGAPCNICEPSERHARIFSLNLKTKKLSTIAKGVRNSVGFDFHPTTGQLWFSDNGRDMMGDDIPPCEINKVSFKGEHFGYPYFHGNDISEPEAAIAAKGKKLSDFTKPQLNLGAHVAPLGIHFYRGQQFPKSYQGKLLVAEHGSWNRSKKSGYKVGLVSFNGDKVANYQDFVTGFMADEQTYGRPVAMIELADGSLLVSDDYAGQIYRINWKG